MKIKQDKFMEKHNFGEKEINLSYIQKETLLCIMKTQIKFFPIRFQIIGTYAEKSKTWRWGWSNRFVPYDLKKHL